MKPGASLVGVVIVAALTALTSNTRATEDDDPVLAVVNGHELRLSFVYEQIESMPLGDQLLLRQERDRFVESLIREEILFQSMLISDFASEPNLRDEVKRATVEHLIKRHVTDRIQVSEAALEAYYREHLSVIRGEEARASQILLDDPAHCEELRRSLNSMAEFETAARQWSKDRQSAARGGDLGAFMNHAGPYGFETQLFEMQPGETRVFESPSGCHVVMLTEKITPPAPTFAEVRARIHELLERQREAQLLTELLEQSERAVTVERRP